MNSPGNILTPLQGALDWATRGFHVFPISAGRKEPPLVSDWENAASIDPVQIKRWSAEHPGCNFGCAPGRSGHVVFDIDRKKGNDGLAELERLTGKHGIELPNTLTVATPNGGFHLYFKGDAHNSVSKIAPGIDVRSRGGYVLIPGSALND